MGTASLRLGWACWLAFSPLTAAWAQSSELSPAAVQLSAGLDSAESALRDAVRSPRAPLPDLTRLSAPLDSLQPAERRKLEPRLKKAAEAAARLASLRALPDWPALESALRAEAPRHALSDDELAAALQTHRDWFSARAASYKDALAALDRALAKMPADASNEAAKDAQAMKDAVSAGRWEEARERSGAMFDRLAAYSQGELGVLLAEARAGFERAERDALVFVLPPQAHVPDLKAKEPVHAQTSAELARVRQVLEELDAPRDPKAREALERLLDEERAPRTEAEALEWLGRAYACLRRSQAYHVLKERDAALFKLTTLHGTTFFAFLDVRDQADEYVKAIRDAGENAWVEERFRAHLWKIRDAQGKEQEAALKDSAREFYRLGGAEAEREAEAAVERILASRGEEREQLIEDYLDRLELESDRKNALVLEYLEFLKEADPERWDFESRKQKAEKDVKARSRSSQALALQILAGRPKLAELAVRLSPGDEGLKDLLDRAGKGEALSIEDQARLGQAVRNLAAQAPYLNPEELDADQRKALEALRDPAIQPLVQALDQNQREIERHQGELALAERALRGEFLPSDGDPAWIARFFGLSPEDAKARELVRQIAVYDEAQRHASRIRGSEELDRLLAAPPEDLLARWRAEERDVPGPMLGELPEGSMVRYEAYAPATPAGHYDDSALKGQRAQVVVLKEGSRQVLDRTFEDGTRVVESKEDGATAWMIIEKKNGLSVVTRVQVAADGTKASETTAYNEDGTVRFVVRQRPLEKGGHIWSFEDGRGGRILELAPGTATADGKRLWTISADTKAVLDNRERILALAPASERPDLKRFLAAYEFVFAQHMTAPHRKVLDNFKNAQYGGKAIQFEPDTGEGVVSAGSNYADTRTNSHWIKYESVVEFKLVQPKGSEAGRLYMKTFYGESNSRGRFFEQIHEDIQYRFETFGDKDIQQIRSRTSSENWAKYGHVYESQRDLPKGFYVDTDHETMVHIREWSESARLSDTIMAWAIRRLTFDDTRKRIVDQMVDKGWERFKGKSLREQVEEVVEAGLTYVPVGLGALKAPHTLTRALLRQQVKRTLMRDMGYSAARASNYVGSRTVRELVKDMKAVRNSPERFALKTAPKGIAREFPFPDARKTAQLERGIAEGEARLKGLQEQMGALKAQKAAGANVDDALRAKDLEIKALRKQLQRDRDALPINRMAEHQKKLKKLDEAKAREAAAKAEELNKLKAAPTTPDAERRIAELERELGVLKAERGDLGWQIKQAERFRVAESRRGRIQSLEKQLEELQALRGKPNAPKNLEDEIERVQHHLGQLRSMTREDFRVIYQKMRLREQYFKAHEALAKDPAVAKNFKSPELLQEHVAKHGDELGIPKDLLPSERAKIYVRDANELLKASASDPKRYLSLRTPRGNTFTIDLNGNRLVVSRDGDLLSYIGTGRKGTEKFIRDLARQGEIDEATLKVLLDSIPK